MTRFVLCLTAAVLVGACQDATGPSHTAPLPSEPVMAASATGSFSTDAVLSSNLATTGNPIRYTVDFRRTFSSITSVSYVFTFGPDPLDPDECLAFFPSDFDGGFGVCNPTAAPQTTRQLFFPCTIHPTVCDHLRDGVSGGVLEASTERAGNPPVSVGLQSLTITIVGESVPAVTIATIDIKPGSSANPINPRSRGLIPVAILTTPAFSATTVNPLSVRFGPSGATEPHGRGHFKDVDGDGDKDLLLHFRTRASGIRCGDSSASVTGTTSIGASFEGSDAIRTVGCKPRTH